MTDLMRPGPFPDEVKETGAADEETGAPEDERDKTGTCPECGCSPDDPWYCETCDDSECPCGIASTETEEDE